MYIIAWQVLLQRLKPVLLFAAICVNAECYNKISHVIKAA